MILYFLYLFVCIVKATNTCVGELGSVEQIHLSLMDEYTMHVMWNSTQDMVKPTVRYFKGTCSSTTEPEWKLAYGAIKPYNPNGFLYLTTITDLDSDSTYCYTIGETCEYSQRSQFRTPNPSSAIFAALSDAGTWGNVTYIMNNLEKDNEVTMVLHPGDLSYGLTESVWDTFGKIVEPVARTKPYMIIPGNWDVKPFASFPFANRYTMPLAIPPSIGETTLNFFYSFNYSVFHIVMLSSYDPYDSESLQYKWLVGDLQLASKDKKRHPWIVVCFHSPMYSSNTGHGGGNEAFRVVVEPLLQEYHVDLVLTGHDHGYERSYPVINNGTVRVPKDALRNYHQPKAPIHILVGTAGATLDTWFPTQPEWSAHREASFGYTKISASHSTMHVTYLRQDHSIGDEFFISKGYTISLGNVMAVVLVCMFTILPFLLYKGLPSGVRNYLMCYDVTAAATSHLHKFI